MGTLPFTEPAQDENSIRFKKTHRVTTQLYLNDSPGYSVCWKEWHLIHMTAVARWIVRRCKEAVTLVMVECPHYSCLASCRLVVIAERRSEACIPGGLSVRLPQVTKQCTNVARGCEYLAYYYHPIIVFKTSLE